ncbi:hypothetical protein [Streptomyces sp. NPDC005890]|uniref:hypothetical protein n=1 Tax=Streptomyces sp. NPDC005890 TaxID=3154568 RepID=UPI0033D20717
MWHQVSGDGHHSLDKLFPGAADHDGVTEGSVLTHIQEWLPVPTPRVRGFGPYENRWRYV